MGNTINPGGMRGGGGESLDKSGFVTGGYIDKNGLNTGSADFVQTNVMPPGYDISNQPNAEINNMPLKTIVDGSYPGDGGF